MSRATLKLLIHTCTKRKGCVLPVQVTIADVEGSAVFAAAATPVGVVAVVARMCEKREKKMGGKEGEKIVIEQKNNRKTTEKQQKNNRKTTEKDIIASELADSFVHACTCNKHTTIRKKKKMNKSLKHMR